MNKMISIFTAMASTFVLCSCPMINLNVSAEDIATFTISCPDTIYIDDNFTTTISCYSNTEFESLQFELTYNSAVLEFSNVYSVTSDKGEPSDYSVSNAGDGVVYILFPDATKYHNMDVSVTFTAKAEGNSNFSVNVSEIMQNEDDQVSISGNPVASKSISVVAKQTETTATTTETTTAETTTETTTTSTSVTTSTSATESTTTDATSTSEQTTTSVESTSTSDTDLTEISTTSLSETTTTVTDTSTNNDSTTTNAPNDDATETSTTAKTNKNTTVSTKNTPLNTSKATTTTAKLSNSSEKKEESAQTGDSFPFLPLVAAIGGSATLAFVTRKKKSK